MGRINAMTEVRECKVSDIKNKVVIRKAYHHYRRSTEMRLGSIQ